VRDVRCTLDLRNVVDTNSSTPPFASAPVAGSFLNIRNVLYNYNPTGTYSFTTRFGSQLASPNVDHNFRFENPADQAFSLPPSDSNANTPCGDLLGKRRPLSRDNLEQRNLDCVVRFQHRGKLLDQWDAAAGGHTTAIQNQSGSERRSVHGSVLHYNPEAIDSRAAGRVIGRKKPGTSLPSRFR
jgi:hypothetical protein